MTATDISHTHLIGCSCHITLSPGYLRPLWYQNKDVRMSLRASWETPFPSHSLDDVNNRCPGWPCVLSLSSMQAAGSARRRHSDAASVIPPSIPPHPPPVTLYARKTGEVQSRLIYGTSKRRHWRLSIIMAVIASCTCIIHWCQGQWLTG